MNVFRKHFPYWPGLALALVLVGLGANAFAQDYDDDEVPPSVEDDCRQQNPSCYPPRNEEVCNDNMDDCRRAYRFRRDAPIPEYNRSCDDLWQRNRKLFYKYCG
jgi:hypothetical protein